MKKIFISLFLVLIVLISNAQSISDESSSKEEKPKLVIGIVVDQMRYDYLHKFYDKYSDGGFKRLMKEGFSCENAHFNYVPTYTAVGHASIYTGTTPSMHGIIANNWYDKTIKESVYCVDDDRYSTVGAKKGGKKSPFRLQVTTFADELKLNIKNKGKVIGISLKDRAAILPVGFTADAAYWFRGKKDAKFITSSFYMEKLPNWASNFNDLGKAKKHLKVWDTLYDIDTYTESIADDNDFEGTFKGEKKPTFPHDLPNLMSKNKNYNLLKASPFGNSLLIDFAKEAIIGENLGKGDSIDFLSMSFSSTDYVGHMFGPESKEIQDTYLRLDKDLEQFLIFLDEKIGIDNYTLFLTADHAVASNPSYLKSRKVNAGYFDFDAFEKYLLTVTKKYFNTTEIIEDISNYQIFLDVEKIEELDLNYEEVANKLKNKAILFDGVYKSATAETLQTTNFTKGVLGALKNGYNQKLSGDIMIVLKPAMLYKKMKGTTHGAAYNYDTHVPLIFFGQGISHGVSKEYTPIIDIAPTISNLLKIEFPNACSGKIIEIP